MDLNHHSLSTRPRVNWTVLPETEMFCFWSRWDLPSLGNLLTWAQGSSDWCQMWCGKLAVHTEALGSWAPIHPWRSWDDRHGPPHTVFSLEVVQKLPMLTVFLVIREGYWNSFQWVNTISWIDLAGEDTTAVWTHRLFCYPCERNEVRLTGVTSWVPAEDTNQNPSPVVAYVPCKEVILSHPGSAVL